MVILQNKDSFVGNLFYFNAKFSIVFCGIWVKPYREFEC